MAGTVILTSEELAVRYDLVRALSRRGLEVRLARSGWEFVLAAGREVPGLMVLEYWLPDMLGDEVLELVRREPELSSVPVILHGAGVSAEVRDRCAKLGPVHLQTDRAGRAEFLADLFAQLQLRERRERRVEVRLPVEVRAGEKRRGGTAVQLSNLGAAVECAFELSEGDAVELAFPAIGEAPAAVAASAVCSVVREAGRTTLGLEFTDPEAIRDLLQVYLKHGAELGERLERIERFPALPAVAARILEVSLREDADLQELVALVRNDPALASHLIRLANSAAYHFASKVTAVERAAALLGIGAVRNAVLGVTVFRHLSHDAAGRLAHELWQHSVAVALGCEKLAARFGVEPGEGFALGLLHDVGKFVLLAAFFREGEGWAGRAPAEHLALDRERELFGMDHAQVGAHILARWGVPESLHECVRAHHDTDAAKEAHPRAPALRLLQAAEALAVDSHLGLGAGEVGRAPSGELAGKETEGLRVGLYRDLARVFAEFGRPVEALDLCNEVVERANQRLCAQLAEAEAHNEMLRLAYERARHQLMSLVQTEKYHALGRLSRGLAHEINNPLSAALANLHSLGAYAVTLASAALGGPSKPEELKEIASDLPAVLEDIESGLQRVQAVARALKAFDRDGSRRLELAHLRPCVQEALQLAGPSRPGGVKIRVGEGQVRELLIDRGGMVRSLVELILNAFAAMPEGGALDIDLREEAASALVVLRDTGEGISEENLARVFEPFFTTRPMGSGRGLGLSFAYAAVSRMHGTLEISSVRGQGTVVQVRLPLSSAERPAPSSVPG